MRTYAQAVEFLFSRLPMFQRIGAAAYKSDLSNTIALCEALGNPQHTFKSVHVAGTNGKGSVSSTLAAIFAKSGYKTGLFTSPHLKDFRERIRVNGIMVDEHYVIQFLERTEHLIDQLQPSFFELSCCMAFDYFRAQQVDVAVIEVGMGGRLDSTNVLLPALAVITSIGFDHQQFLGNSLAQIAGEKGGIIKPKTPVVVSENEQIVVDTLREIAQSREAPIVFVQKDDEGLSTDLKGIYQKENMRTVRAAVESLRGMGWLLPHKAVAAGAGSVMASTGLRGRWELLSNAPRTIADVGHNEEGVRFVVQMLGEARYHRLHMVWGMSADKDAQGILSMLPRNATYYWCRPDVPRGKDALLLQSEAREFALEGNAYTSVQAALASAKSSAGPDDIIFVGGSVFVVAEVL